MSLPYYRVLVNRPRLLVIWQRLFGGGWKWKVGLQGNESNTAFVVNVGFGHFTVEFGRGEW